MKRLVLVDRSSNRVCGDTSAPGPYAQLWTEIAGHLEDNVAVLSASAARLLDQNQGKTAQNYVFSPFASDREAHGYLVYECMSECGSQPPILSENLDTDEVILHCVASLTIGWLYVGFVRCDL